MPADKCSVCFGTGSIESYHMNFGPGTDTCPSCGGIGVLSPEVRGALAQLNRLEITQLLFGCPLLIVVPWTLWNWAIGPYDTILTICVMVVVVCSAAFVSLSFPVERAKERHRTLLIEERRAPTV
jgi:hypothetical protein